MEFVQEQNQKKEILQKDINQLNILLKPRLEAFYRKNYEDQNEYIRKLIDNKEIQSTKLHQLENELQTLLKEIEIVQNQNNIAKRSTNDD